MSTDAGTFHFYLSPAELHWLAGAFGLTRLPLTDDPLRELSALKLENELQSALESLQTRGLMRLSGGVRWQVDSMPAALIRWLGNAKWMLVIESQSKTQAFRRMNAFFVDGQGMTITLEDKIFHFVLYLELSLLITESLAWLGQSHLESSPTAGVYQLPRAVIGTAWGDKADALNILKMAKISNDKASSICIWLDSLEWIGYLSRVQLVTENAEIESQAILCGNQEKNWGSRRAKNNSNMFSMSPLSLQDMTKIFQNLLEN